MKIVIVTPSAPHPFKNAAARWYYAMIAELARRGHEVVCLTGGEDDEDTIRQTHKYLDGRAASFRYHEYQRDLWPLARKFRSLLYPRSEMRFNRGLAADLEDEVSKGYDILHLEQLWTGWLGFHRPRCLLNIHHFETIDVQHHHPGWRMWKDYVQMLRGTRRILKRFSYVRVTTPRLYEKARSINPQAQYWTVPICLDMSLYKVQAFVEQPVVGLLGSMCWYPSQSAAKRLIERIWPLVREAVPSARLVVAGWKAKMYLGDHAAQPGLVIEEDLAGPEEFFSKVAVMVYAPARGSGMKVKNLEAMAYGVPVVTTWEGVEGIEYQEGIQCFVEETDQMLARRIVELLLDRDMRLRMRGQARRLMEQKYSAEATVGRMEEIYGLMRNGRAT
jgi:glycosyltransferase involved in cell wall biosynthesis